MRLDEAQVTIRERSWLDNLDLALRVMRRHFKTLLVLALVGPLPFALLNAGLIQLVLGNEPLEDASMYALYWAIGLVMIEAPLATAPLTLYLGKALFVERPSAREIARDFLASLPQLILFQLILRFFLIVFVVTWIIPYAIWPFWNEVILLERNPIIGRNGQISTFQRCSLLHRASGGEYMAHGLAAMALSLVLIGALKVSQSWLLSYLLGIEETWAWELATTQVALWVTVMFFTVARFLNYLNQRIRTEGWEVELSLRAERDRIARHAA